MRHRGFEPRTTWLKVKCSTDWANIPYNLFSYNAQSRNRTSDTWIFSPLLYQLSYLGTSYSDELRGQDLNLRPSGYEPDELPDCSTPRYLISFAFQQKPMIGLEPITCWLQISCSANWATSAKNNGTYRARTCDPLLVRQMLSQLS